MPVQLREYAAAAEAALGFCAEAPKRGYTRRFQPAPPAHALLAAIAEAPPPPEEEESESSDDELLSPPGPAMSDTESEDDEFGMIAASSGASTFEADRQRVLDFYSAEGTGEEGCQVGYVAGALGMDAVRLRQIVDFLESEGQLYATLDNYHKSIYEPGEAPPLGMPAPEEPAPEEPSASQGGAAPAPSPLPDGAAPEKPAPHGTLNDAAPATAAVTPAHERMTAFVNILVADPEGVDMDQNGAPLIVFMRKKNKAREAVKVRKSKRMLGSGRAWKDPTLSFVFGYSRNVPFRFTVDHNPNLAADA